MRIVLIKDQLAYEGFTVKTRGFPTEMAARIWVQGEKDSMLEMLNQDPGGYEELHPSLPLSHCRNGTAWELISEDGNSTEVLAQVCER